MKKQSVLIDSRIKVIKPFKKIKSKFKGDLIQVYNDKTHDLEVVRTVAQLGSLFVQSYILLHLLGVL